MEEYTGNSSRAENVLLVSQLYVGGQGFEPRPSGHVPNLQVIGSTEGKAIVAERE